jgi:hypothetical protein
MDAAGIVADHAAEGVVIVRGGGGAEGELVLAHRLKACNMPSPSSEIAWDPREKDIRT